MDTEDGKDTTTTARGRSAFPSSLPISAFFFFFFFKKKFLISSSGNQLPSASLLLLVPLPVAFTLLTVIAQFVILFSICTRIKVKTRPKKEQKKKPAQLSTKVYALPLDTLLDAKWDGRASGNRMKFFLGHVSVLSWDMAANQAFDLLSRFVKIPTCGKKQKKPTDQDLVTMLDPLPSITLFYHLSLPFVSALKIIDTKVRMTCKHTGPILLWLSLSACASGLLHQKKLFFYSFFPLFFPLLFCFVSKML